VPLELAHKRRPNRVPISTDSYEAVPIRRNGLFIFAREALRPSLSLLEELIDTQPLLSFTILLILKKTAVSN
jgi:hypothetical protein